MTKKMCLPCSSCILTAESVESGRYRFRADKEYIGSEPLRAGSSPLCRVRTRPPPSFDEFEPHAFLCCTQCTPWPRHFPIVLQDNPSRWLGLPGADIVLGRTVHCPCRPHKNGQGCMARLEQHPRLPVDHPRWLWRSCHSLRETCLLVVDSRSHLGMADHSPRD